MVSLASVHLSVCVYLAKASKHILDSNGCKVNKKFSNSFSRYLEEEPRLFIKDKYDCHV